MVGRELASSNSGPISNETKTRPCSLSSEASVANPKLNQIIAVVAGKKTQAQKVLTEAYQELQKPALLEGLDRVYKPRNEDGETLPPERKLVQQTVGARVKTVRGELADVYDVVLTQDTANCVAKADVVVDGRVVLKDVPVTYLLFLEKQLTDLETFVSKLPTLDPAEEWSYNPSIDGYTSRPYETLKTKKVMKNHEKAPATEKHPAQVEVYTEDVVIGTWTNVKSSGAIPAQERNRMLTRVRQLQDAVKMAREEANSIEVTPRKAGEAVFDFVFGTAK